MNDNSTIGVCNENVKNNLTAECKPSAQTLDLLRMFARSCSEEKSLQGEFLNVCLN